MNTLKKPSPKIWLDIHEQFKLFKRWAISPVGSTLLIGLALVAISQIAVYRVRAFTSDDIIWQNALLTWHPFHHQIYYADAGVSYIAKVPIYWLLSLILPAGRHVILVTSVLFAVVNFYIIYRCGLYFLRLSKAKLTRLTLLPFLWIASFGFAITQQFFSPNLHNIEMGAVVLVITGACKLLRGEYDSRKTRDRAFLFISAAFLIGLMSLDDRYFVYYGFGPALVICFVCWLRQKTAWRHIMAAAGIAIMAAIFYVLIKKFVVAAGVQFVSGDAVAGASAPVFIPAANFYSSIINTVQSLLVLFGADFFGRVSTKPLTIITIVNALLLIIGLSWSANLMRGKIKLGNKDGGPFELKALAALIFFVIGVYALTNVSFGVTSSYRYMMIVPYILAILMCAVIYYSSLPIKKLIFMAISLAIALNIASSVFGVYHHSIINEPYDSTQAFMYDQTYNYKLIDFLKANGLSKGYADYWDANINGYLSQGKIHFLPTKCADTFGGTQRFNWLVDGSQFDIKASRTFFIVNPNFSIPLTCSTQTIMAQFGNPARTVDFEGRTIYIYNYDIGAKLWKQPGTSLKSF